MKIKKADLLPALARASKVASGELVQTRCVYLSADAGKLNISATSGNQYVIERVPCKGDLEPMLVPATLLTSVVTHGDEDQEFSKNDKGRLAYDVGARGTLSTVAEDFPTPPADMKPVAVNPVDLAKGINAVKWAMSQDKARLNLNNVHIELSAKRIFCAATVGIYFAFYEQKAIAGDLTVNVYREFVDALCESLTENAQLVVSPNWIGAESEKSCFYCKLTEDTYPPMGKLLSAKRVALGVVDRKEWMRVFGMVQALRGITEQQCAKVAVSLGKKACAFEYTGNDSDLKKSVPGKFVEKELRLNANTFVKCLAAFPEDSNPKLLQLDDGNENPPIVIEDDSLVVMTTQLRKDA